MIFLSSFISLDRVSTSSIKKYKTEPTNEICKKKTESTASIEGWWGEDPKSEWTERENLIFFIIIIFVCVFELNCSGFWPDDAKSFLVRSKWLAIHPIHTTCCLKSSDATRRNRQKFEILSRVSFHRRIQSSENWMRKFFSSRFGMEREKNIIYHRPKSGFSALAIFSILFATSSPCHTTPKIDFIHGLLACCVICFSLHRLRSFVGEFNVFVFFSARCCDAIERASENYSDDGKQQAASRGSSWKCFSVFQFFSSFRSALLSSAVSMSISRW